MSKMQSDNDGYLGITEGRVLGWAVVGMGFLTYLGLPEKAMLGAIKSGAEAA